MKKLLQKKNLEDVIRKTAALARLRFPENELARYREKAEAILTYVERLNELDTRTTLPMSHAREAPFRGRDDIVAAPTTADRLVDLFPAHERRLLRVPKVMDS